MTMAALSFTSCLVVALSLLSSVRALNCYSQGNVTVPSCSCHPTCGTCGYNNDPTKAVDCITCADGSAVKPVYADGTGYCGEPPTGSNCFLQPEVALDNCKCHPTCGTCGYNNDPTKAVDCITCADGSAVKPVYADGTGYCGEPPTGSNCFLQPEVALDNCKCHPTCGTCGYNNDPTKAVDCITCADGSAVKPVYADGTGYCGEPPTGSNCFLQPEVALDNCKCHPTCGTCGYNNDPTKAVDCVTCADGSAVKPVYADGTGYCGEPPPGTSDDTSGGQAPTSYHVVKSSMTLEGVTKDTFDAAKFSAGMAAALGLEADLIRVQDVTEVSRRHLLAAGVKVDFMVAADDVADATQGAASLKALDPTKIVESLKVAGIPVTAVSAIEAAPGEVAASEVDATSPTAKAPSPAPATTTKAPAAATTTTTKAPATTTTTKAPATTTTKAPATTTTKAPVKKTSGAFGAAPSFVVATAIAAMAA